VLIWASFEALLSNVLLVDSIEHWRRFWWTLTKIDIILSANVGICQSAFVKRTVGGCDQTLTVDINKYSSCLEC
jgi:hypothetical protein